MRTGVLVMASTRRRGASNPGRDLGVGIAVVVIAVLAFYFSLTKTIPFVGKNGTLVTARFSEPNQLEPGSTPVRIDGVNVGVVDKVSETDGGRYGTVVLRITKSGVHLHSDATAQIKFRTLLGANFVVAIDPGSPSAPPLGPAGIPLAHTSVQQEFDDVLGVFNGHTPAATRTDLKQLSQAVSGKPLGTLIDTTPSALQPTAAAFRALQGTDPGDLAGLVSAASRTTKVLAGDESDLQTVISEGDATLSATAGAHVALGQALDDGPAALRATDRVAGSIEQTLPPLNTLVTALGPGARALAPAAAAARPAVTALSTVLTRAQPLLHALRPAITKLSAASGPTRGLVDALKPTVTRLNAQLIPWLQSKDSDLNRPVYNLIAPTFAALGSAASLFDDKAHVINFPVQPGFTSLPIVPCTLVLSSATPLQCDTLEQTIDGLLGDTSTSTGTSAFGTARAKAGSAK